MMELSWTGLDQQHHAVTVATVEDLDTELGRLHAAITDSHGVPQTVSLLGDSDDLPALRFEVGAQQSSVTWTDEQEREHESRGDDPAMEPEFSCVDAGDYSGLPPRMLVPASAAREAARDFFRTNGARPSCIRWNRDLAVT